MPERELTFAEKIRTVQTNTGKSAPRRREPLDENGRRTKVVDRPTESGAHATITNRMDDKGSEHQDVHVQAGVIR